MFYPDIDTEQEFLSFRAHQPNTDLDSNSIIAMTNIVAAELMEILGPLLWAAFVVSWVYAQFFTN